jgi:nucleotide-binding universal stress UspA family protein
MQVLLLPTDFSETAKNAGMYALKLAEQLGASKIVVYHSYEIPVTIDPMVPGIQMLEIDSLKEGSAKGLERFRLELLPFAHKSITIENFNEYGALTEGLDDVCKAVKADLVVMGITGGGIIEETLIGSNTLSVAKHTHIPVIIVPSAAKFTPIEEVMLTSDFDKEDRHVPVEAVTKLITETKAKLFVFHTDEEADEYPPGKAGEEYALYSLLHELNPEFHFSQNKNYMEAVNDFASEYQVDLIITIAKKQGFLGNLFAESHTKKLAFHSHVPVMVIHE